MKLEVHGISETLFSAWRQAILAQPFGARNAPADELRDLITNALRADLRQMADPEDDALEARVVALEARVHALEQAR